MGTSFGCSDFWDFLGYDWSMLFKATINQSYRIGFLKRGAELRCADPQSAYWIAFCGVTKAIRYGVNIAVGLVLKLRGVGKRKWPNLIVVRFSVVCSPSVDLH